jgi:hypothetical protein
VGNDGPDGTPPGTPLGRAFENLPHPYHDALPTSYREGTDTTESRYQSAFRALAGSPTGTVPAAASPTAPATFRQPFGGTFSTGFRSPSAALPRHLSRHRIGTHPAPCRRSPERGRGLASKGTVAEGHGTIPQPCRRDPPRPSGRAPDPRGDGRPFCTSACARAGNDSACITSGVPPGLPPTGGGGDWPLRQSGTRPVRGHTTGESRSTRSSAG